MASGFEVRGVIEGFYGPPWSPAARIEAVEFLAPRGANAYVYAPKDDAFHRARWREPYPKDEFDALIGLAARCHALGVCFGYAISPGLDIDPGSHDDRQALWAKLSPFVAGGVEWLILAFDDVPARPGAGAGHGDLTAWLADRSGGRVSVVPTEYVGSSTNAYLEELTAALPPDTELFWTGSTVVSAEITAAEAEARRAATGGHPLLVWDNYPVNDAFMAGSLHLGPLRGRDPGLAGVCAGLLANPMTQARASLLPLATVMEFLADPAGYDPAAAWERAIADLGATPQGQAMPALRSLARACATSRLDVRAPLHDLVDALEAGAPEAAKALQTELEDAAALPAGLPPEWLEEARSWAEQAAAEASLALSALGALSAPAGSGGGWGPVLSLMGMLVQWQVTRAGGSRVVFGPRFACYPGIVLDDAGAVRVDPELSLVEDESAVDRLCRLALHGAAES